MVISRFFRFSYSRWVRFYCFRKVVFVKKKKKIVRMLKILVIVGLRGIRFILVDVSMDGRRFGMD